jgi:hypothetical protein
LKVLTDAEFKSRMSDIEKQNLAYQQHKDLKEAKTKYKKHLKLPSTSKLMAFYLFVVLNIVLLYAMTAMWYFSDLTYLGVLITDVAAQVLTYLIYSQKAVRENTVGGIKYDMAMKSVEDVTIYKDSETESCDDSEAVG